MHPNALLDHAATLLAQLLTFAQPADTVVAQYTREQRGLGARERPWLADTVYRVLREKPLLEWLWQACPAPQTLPVPPAKGAPKKPSVTRPVWGLTLLALRHEPSATQTLPVEWQDWLAACVALERQQDPSLRPSACVHGLPEWLAQALQTEVGPDFLALAHALQQAAPLDLRVNLLKAKRAVVQQALAEAGVNALPTRYSPWGLRVTTKVALQNLPLFRDGTIEVQDEGSQLLALLLQPKRQDMVADFCAGAGGKTLALGAMMRNGGRLYALDTSAHRLQALAPRLQRSGLSNVHTMALAHENDPRLERLWGKMDRVLVDAPCSGLGTLRRSPDLKWRQKPAEIADIAALQGRILASAARLVKPGGRLVYATCSVLSAENEAVAAQFSAGQRDWAVLPAQQVLAQAGVEHAPDLVRDGFVRLWPHRHGSDGFFAAVWERRR